MGSESGMSTARATRSVGTATKRDIPRRGRRFRRRDAPSSALVRVKNRDACWTVFVIDPFAVPLSAFAARLRAVTPNRLTGLSVVLALGAAALFATGQLVAGGGASPPTLSAACTEG